MKLQTSIETLIDYRNHPMKPPTPDQLQAIEQVIQALKAVQEIRNYPFPDRFLQLPGETINTEGDKR